MAERAECRGSPTILIDGRDPFATGAEPIGMSCRVFRTEDGPQGPPTEAQPRLVLEGQIAELRSALSLRRESGQAEESAQGKERRAD